MNDAEKVREALTTLCDAVVFPGASTESGEVSKDWQPCQDTHAGASAALDSILTELAEANVETERWKLKWIGDTTALEEERDAAEERAEQAEAAIKAVEEHIATVKGWTMDMHGQTLRAALYIEEALAEDKA